MLICNKAEYLHLILHTSLYFLNMLIFLKIFICYIFFILFEK